MRCAGDEVEFQVHLHINGDHQWRDKTAERCRHVPADRNRKPLFVCCFPRFLLMTVCYVIDCVCERKHLTDDYIVFSRCLPQIRLPALFAKFDELREQGDVLPTAVLATDGKCCGCFFLGYQFHSIKSRVCESDSKINWPDPFFWSKL